MEMGDALMTSAPTISVQIQPHHQPYEAMRDAWRAVEALGVDGIYNWDHLSPRFGDLDGNTFECWTTLGSMAEVTERVTIGPLITNAGFRNPGLMADMARTVDHASGGRLVLGLGAGGWTRDFDDLGLDPTTAGERLRAMEQAIGLMRERWQTKHPAPVRGSIPILIGGNGEKLTLRIVAEHAQIWNGQGDPEELKRLNGVLDGWCERVGRDPAEIERSVLLIRPYQAELADDYLAAGITHLIYSVRAPENDLGPVEHLLDWRANL